MKKWGKTLLGLVLSVTLCACPLLPVLAAATPKVTVDGNAVSFPKGAEPFLDGGGRVQMAVRFVNDALGAQTAWDGKTSTVTITKADTEIRLKTGSKTIYINGQAKETDTAAMIKDGWTFVPLRFVSEAFGATVDWQANTGVANITTGSTNGLAGKTENTQSKQHSKEDFYRILRYFQDNAPQNIVHSHYQATDRDPAKTLIKWQMIKKGLAEKFGDKVANDVYDHIKQKTLSTDDLPFKSMYYPELDKWVVILSSESRNMFVAVYVAVIDEDMFSQTSE